MTDLIPNIWTFLALTLVIGGAGAFVTGRTMAHTWRERWKAVAYMVPLSAAVRFLHYALYEEPLVSALLFAADAAVLVAIAALGFRMTRARQMRERYGWMGAQ